MQATIHSQHKAYTNQITRPDLSTEWKWKAVSHHQLLVTSCTTQSMEFIRPKYWNGVAFPFSRGYSQPRDPTQVSHIAGGFFTSWATQKPKNAGVGNLSLLQQIFLTQELNRVSCIAGGFFPNWAIRKAQGRSPLRAQTKWKKEYYSKVWEKEISNSVS